MNFLILQADATEGASSFFDSPWWKFTTMMAKAMLVAMWLALVFWTYKDAKRRITDPLMIGVAVATSLIFPYVGTLFYVILRPPEYLEDVLERDLEIRAREQELVGGANRCPACRTPVRDDFLVCPKCRRELKVRLRQLRQAAGSVLEGLPLLRDRGRQCRKAGSQAGRGGRGRTLRLTPRLLDSRLTVSGE